MRHSAVTSRRYIWVGLINTVFELKLEDVILRIMYIMLNLESCHGLQDYGRPDDLPSYPHGHASDAWDKWVRGPEHCGGVQ
jgi:hypothetical protein